MSSRGRTVRRALAAVAGAGAALVLAAPPTWAHGGLESSDPEPNSTLQAAPATVTLTFDEAVTTPEESIRVYGPDGQRVDDGTVVHPDGAGGQVSVGLVEEDRGSAEGTYLVTWRVVSDDSHPVSGEFTFSVLKPSAAPSAPMITTDRTVAILLGVTRGVGYLGACLLLGGAAFLWRCWPGGWSSLRARRLVCGGALTIVLTAAMALLLKGPYDAGLGLGDLGRPSLVRDVLGTTYGRGMLARLVLAGLAYWWLTSPASHRRSLMLPVGLIGGVALAATYAVTGHAVSGSNRPLALASYLVHVSAMSFWLGGLLLLTLVVLRSPEPDLVVRRFSPIAAGCVLTLVATGTFQAWRQIGSWAALTGTTYGRELLVKVGLVALALVAAGFSRAWVRGRGTPVRVSVAAEAVLGIAVLVVTSPLVATEPARTAYHSAATAVTSPDAMP